MRGNIPCSICGTKFSNISANAKYCSAECKAEGQKQARKNWESDNPGYDAKRMKAYRDKNKQPPKFFKK